MSNRRLMRRPAGLAASVDDGTLGPDAASAVEENVQAIKRWEHGVLLARSRAEQVSDWIACTAGSGAVLLLHVGWFAAWVSVNSA